jgi:hypothetical protein
MNIWYGIVDSHLPFMSSNQQYSQNQSHSINNVPCPFLSHSFSIQWQSHSCLAKTLKLISHNVSRSRFSPGMTNFFKTSRFQPSTGTTSTTYFRQVTKRSRESGCRGSSDRKRRRRWRISWPTATSKETLKQVSLGACITFF